MRNKNELEKKVNECLNLFERKTFKRDNDKEETLTVFKNSVMNEDNKLYKKFSDLIHENQGGENFVYDKVYRCLLDIRDYIICNEDANIDEIRDILPEYIDSAVDVYTHDLTTWLNDSVYNVYYITEVQEEFGMQEDGFKLLAMAIIMLFL